MSKKYVLGVDIGCGEEKSAVNVWKDGNIIYTLSTRDTNNPLGKWFKGEIRRFKQRRKALIYAVTHGYTIQIFCYKGYFEITKPSELRKVFRLVPFMPKYVITKDSINYIIRKSKICSFNHVNYQKAGS